MPTLKYLDSKMYQLMIKWTRQILQEEYFVEIILSSSERYEEQWDYLLKWQEKLVINTTKIKYYVKGRITRSK